VRLSPHRRSRILTHEGGILAEILVLVLAAIPWAGDLCMAGSPADAFDGQRAWLADSVLSSPEFAGRKSGSPEGGAAEQWIAARFAEAGLRPAAGDGTFLQSFPVIGYQSKKASLELLDGPYGRVPFIEGVDWTLLLTPAAGKVTAEVVVVGYGFDAPERGRNDYEGIDLHGKVAVIIRGRPADGKNWDEEFKRTHTFAAAKAHGAIAVLYWQDGRVIAGAALSPDVYDPMVPAGFISNRVLDLLLRETGWTGDGLRERLAEGPFPLATGKRVRISVEIQGAPTATAHNVIGMIRGNDPLLGSEVVIIGAHHDHIGLDTGHRPFPGANDNGSGAAAILEMARAAQQADWHPRRTVLFATFGGEELGLLGSKVLAARMPFDSSQCVAMINLDMVGQGDGGTGIGGGNRLGPPYFAWRNGLDSASVAGLEEYVLSSEESSDYAPFASRGIRTLGCWSRGHHGRYHDIEDRVRYVRPEVLGSVGKTVSSLLESIADHPVALKDGLGHERALRAGALQIAFTPLDAATLSDPVRTRLDGEGRIAGRLVACDEGRVTADEVLRRLGRIRGLARKNPWLRVAEGIGPIDESREELALAVMPVVATSLLDRLGPDAARSLCAAGIGGAAWTGTGGGPTRQTLEVLAEEKRLLLVDAGTPWREALRDRENPRILLRWSRGGGPLPDPPDSTFCAPILLIFSVEGVSDSTAIRHGVQSWGAKRTHIDFGAGLEEGVDDLESLRFIAWLRRQGWTTSEIEDLLGGNLRSY
jgi:hypothetical protein